LRVRTDVWYSSGVAYVRKLMPRVRAVAVMIPPEVLRDLELDAGDYVVLDLVEGEGVMVRSLRRWLDERRAGGAGAVGSDR